MITHQSVTLADLRESELGTVLELRGSVSQRQRLGEMGMTPGCPVRVVRTSPFGDSFVVELRNFRFALRRSVSRNVIVSREPAQ